MKGFLVFVGVCLWIVALGGVGAGDIGGAFVAFLIGIGAFFLASCFEEVTVTDVRIGKPRKERRFRWPGA